VVLERLSLDDKVALITGGGRGLGKAWALALARAGADVVVAARTIEQVEAVAEEVRAMGRRALAIQTDVMESAQINSMVERAISEMGKVDILINNAGGGAPGKPIWEITDEEWHAGIDLNLTSAFFCSRAVAQHMVERGSGKIINVASGWGYRGARNGYMYGCSKAALINFTRFLGMSLGREGVQVSCIAPGLFPHLDVRSPEERANIEARAGFQPMGRYGTDEEIGPLAVYLASEASSYLTGETVLIDGGALPAAYAPTGFQLSVTP
jgi:NAD(P)-dependent dehydrogenase (short-subunit alcohol dehydrogenase family)